MFRKPRWEKLFFVQHEIVENTLLVDLKTWVLALHASSVAVDVNNHRQ